MLYIGCDESSVDNTMIFNILLNCAYTVPSLHLFPTAQAARRMGMHKELERDTARPAESKLMFHATHIHTQKWEIGEHQSADGKLKMNSLFCFALLAHAALALFIKLSLSGPTVFLVFTPLIL